MTRDKILYVLFFPVIALIVFILDSDWMGDIEDEFGEFFIVLFAVGMTVITPFLLVFLPSAYFLIFSFGVFYFMVRMVDKSRSRFYKGLLPK